MCNCKTSTCRTFSFFGDLLSLKTLSLVIMKNSCMVCMNWLCNSREHHGAIDNQCRFQKNCLWSPWSCYIERLWYILGKYSCVFADVDCQLHVYHGVHNLQLKAASSSIIICSCKRFRCAIAIFLSRRPSIAKDALAGHHAIEVCMNWTCNYWREHHGAIDNQCRFQKIACDLHGHAI